MRLHHLAFRTRDLGRLEAFYEKVMGFTIARRDGVRSTWLVAGDARVMLEVADGGEPVVPEGSRELAAFAIAEHDVPAWESRLAEAGVAIEARTAFTLYFRDPDGRRIAVSHYAFA